tara:strand:+ start:98 stop:1534 length:1437 start_codon:yes stop_codon:yes gene_type:complete
MAIYLGNQIISSNPTGTGALYLGEQNICTAYLGAVQIFDNCAVANTNVRLNITGSYQGNATGQITESPPDGYTISGQPGVSGTLILSSPSYPGAPSYQCDGGCPDVNPKSISYTFPSSGTSIVTSSRSGGLSTVATNFTRTLAVDFSGVANQNEGVNYSFSTSSSCTGCTSTTNNSVTGPSGSTYSFSITVVILGDNTSSITPSNGQIVNSTITDTNTDTVSFTGSITANTYTLNAATSFNYSVTGGISGQEFTVGSLSPSSETKASTESYSFTQSGLVANAGYQFTSGPTSAYSITNFGAASLSQTMQPSMDGQTLNVNVTGAISPIVNTLTTSTNTGICPNDICINGSGAQTIYYTGSLPTNVYTNSGLSSSLADGIYKNNSGGALTVSGGVGTQGSCVTFLNTFSGYTFSSTSTSACSGSHADNFFGDGGTPSTSGTIFSGNDGCTTMGAGYISNGSTWTETNSSGGVIGYGTCY